MSKKSYASNLLLSHGFSFLVPAQFVFILLLPFLAQARISVMYAHDKLSDIVAEQCFNEMFPKKQIEVEESDEPCIIFCVLKKLGIMSPNGVINLDIYR